MGPAAARLNDEHICPASTEGVPHVGGEILPPCATRVWIGGSPAARATVDMAACASGPPALIVKGSRSVYIQTCPAARIDDPTAHGGMIANGCNSVRIGG